MQPRLRTTAPANVCVFILSANVERRDQRIIKRKTAKCLYSYLLAPLLTSGQTLSSLSNPLVPLFFICKLGGIKRPLSFVEKVE